MSQASPRNFSRRTVTFAAGAMLDADGIRTSFATVAAPVTVLPASFNGVLVSTTTGVISPLPRTITIARSNSAGQFSVSPIVINGKRGGAFITDSITPANINGNDILRSVAAFDTITSIDIPTQGGTGGTFTIGVQDICTQVDGAVFQGVELAAAGTLYVQYGESSGSATDAIIVPAALVGYLKEIAPSRILTSGSQTTVGVTVYL